MKAKICAASKHCFVRNHCLSESPVTTFGWWCVVVCARGLSLSLSICLSLSLSVSLCLSLSLSVSLSLRQRQTDRDRQAETDRYRQKQTETDRETERQADTYRNSSPPGTVSNEHTKSDITHNETNPNTSCVLCYWVEQQFFGDQIFSNTIFKFFFSF